MPYCLSCGKLRRTDGGLCVQCAADMSVRKKSDAQYAKAKIMRNVMREKRGEANGKAKP
jgi:hypothetical protein